MCTVCSHPNRLEIERDLLACPSAAAVAACHRLPLEEVKQHKARPQARIEHAQRQLEQIRLADSIARLNLLLEKTMKILAAAEDNGDQKLMLQAVREAERLTKLVHSLSPEQEAASFFMETSDPGWPQTGSTPRIQAWTQHEVRQAIQRSLRTPCAGARLEDELPPEQSSPPEKPNPSARKAKPFMQPLVPKISWANASPTVTVLEAGTATTDFPAAIGCNRAGPN